MCEILLHNAKLTGSVAIRCSDRLALFYKIMKIIRVFPRRTNATPDDDLAIVGRTPGFFDEADEIHVSVAFTWDLPRAEWLAKQ